MSEQLIVSCGNLQLCLRDLPRETGEFLLRESARSGQPVEQVVRGVLNNAAALVGPALITAVPPFFGKGGRP